MSPKIKAVEAIAFVPALRRRQAEMSWFTARTTRHNILVRIVCDDGLEGFGESMAGPGVTGETALGAKILIEQVLAPVLIGLRPLDINQAMQRVHKAAHGTAAASKAVDLALHDLAGKSLGVAVSDLLGGPLRTELPAARHLHSGDVEVDCEETREAVAQRYPTLKVKVGKAPVAEDLARVRAIRETAGDGMGMTVDANAGWQRHEAVEFARAARDLGVDLIEQPVAKHDLAGMAAVVAAGGPAVAADDGVEDVWALQRHVEARAADAIVLKLLKPGGLRAALRLLALAETNNLAVYIGGMSGETGISTAAALHLGACLSDPPIGVAIAAHYLERDIVRTPVLPKEGTFHVPEGPGLGVEVDMDVVEEYRLKEA